MQYYLRQVIEDTNNGVECPVQTLTMMRQSVPTVTLRKAWVAALDFLFMEVGDTAYQRFGYHNTVDLIENYLLNK